MSLYINVTATKHRLFFALTWHQGFALQSARPKLAGITKVPDLQRKKYEKVTGVSFLQQPLALTQLKISLFLQYLTFVISMIIAWHMSCCRTSVLFGGIL